MGRTEQVTGMEEKKQKFKKVLVRKHDEKRPTGKPTCK
jgi:hypothetical protein